MNFINTPIRHRDFMSSTSSIIESIHRKMSEGQESMILSQLNDFISRGLIVVETTSPILVQDADSDRLVMRQACQLKLKDQEYIQKLELENAELKAKLEAISAAIEGASQ